MELHKVQAGRVEKRKPKNSINWWPIVANISQHLDLSHSDDGIDMEELTNLLRQIDILKVSKIRNCAFIVEQ